MVTLFYRRDFLFLFTQNILHSREISNEEKTFKKLLFLGGTATLLLSGTSYYLHIHSPEHTMNTTQKVQHKKRKNKRESRSFARCSIREPV